MRTESEATKRTDTDKDRLRQPGRIADGDRVIYLVVTVDGPGEIPGLLDYLMRHEHILDIEIRRDRP